MLPGSSVTVRPTMLAQMPSVFIMRRPIHRTMMFTAWSSASSIGRTACGAMSWR
jgi:hypothetical protein